MIKDNIKGFMKLMNSDEELQKQLKAAAESFSGDRTDEKAVFEAVIAPIAKEKGYDFTYEDMVELAESAEAGELSEDELTTAAGGGGTAAVCTFIGAGTGVGVSNIGVGACKVVGVGFGWFYGK